MPITAFKTMNNLPSIPPLPIAPPTTPYFTYQPSPELPQTDVPPTKVRDLRPGMRGVNLDVVVIDKYVIESRKGPRFLFWVGDDSGSVILSLLDADIGHKVHQGNMLHLINCESRFFKGSLQVALYPNTGKLERYADMLQAFEPEPNVSHYLWEPDGTRAGAWTQREPETKSMTWYIPPPHPTLRPAILPRQQPLQHALSAQPQQPPSYPPNQQPPNHFVGSRGPPPYPNERFRPPPSVHQGPDRSRRPDKRARIE
ncbi:uncharacterized protein SPPG_05427 [Spizellomyces punctatus DAOM BR117]|uniref:OB domain-containing protein n=1 Tax=Spizellomyces punctatus (strain DAOM BR117) TaxID=645134 RepID=A0A0L0HEK0_SPIPD|nr:uncharacterized protein SPPG_05427 [Spizellomyces punctatus DAOM BR117]KNC99173.1 hypothetical protein SPPG_05427 [Spizellomyces punctatus DAOM BR117]|eukprot:XP_016607213.1 hypothetical protein SPPG_05427 [Spizellomyces punctatus DAOM BR117]